MRVAAEVMAELRVENISWMVGNGPARNSYTIDTRDDVLLAVSAELVELGKPLDRASRRCGAVQ